MDEQQTQTRKPSIAKAIVAQQKPRDSTGRFLSGDELANYQAQQQQAQFAAEKERMNALLGRTTSQPVSTQMQTPVQSNQPIMQQGSSQNNFQAILNANKPGSNEDSDRWNVLLGKKKNQGQNNNNFRW